MMSNEAREMTTTEWIWSLGAAAGPWVKIEPGCEMPEVGKRVLLLFPNGEVWLGSLYRHVDNWDAWQWHSDKDRSRGWTGFGSKGGPTHYAVVRMPEAE